MDEIYHEKQSMAFCALHAINNLLQHRAFTKMLLDDISHSLSPQQAFNPHRSIFGVGFYDINVIHAALALHGLQFKWFDRRKELCTLPLDKITGLIVNKALRRLFLTTRHWFAVIPHPRAIAARELDMFDSDLSHMYFNVDSMLPKPQQFDNKLQVVEFLEQILKADESNQILVVYKNRSAQATAAATLEESPQLYEIFDEHEFALL